MPGSKSDEPWGFTRKFQDERRDGKSLVETDFRPSKFYYRSLLVTQGGTDHEKKNSFSIFAAHHLLSHYLWGITQFAMGAAERQTRHRNGLRLAHHGPTHAQCQADVCRRIAHVG
jgi:hypothetical protein